VTLAKRMRSLVGDWRCF